MSTPAAVESRCGLIGAFPGDASTLATLADLRLRLATDASASAKPVTTAEIRGLLSLLPWSGRVEFCAKALYPPSGSPAVLQRNSALILQLFRECFEAITAMPAASAGAKTNAKADVPVKAENKNATESEDDEWEIVSVSLSSDAPSAAPAVASSSSASGSAPPAGSLLFLKSSEYSVLRALVSALPSLGPVSVTLFDEYFSRTTSTVFRSPFVHSIVALSPALFSDERLENVYRSSVESQRREMEKQCRELAGARAGFITRLLDAGLIPDPTEFVHFATAQTLESALLKNIEVVSEPATPSAPVIVVKGGAAAWSWSLNWNLHGEVYLRFLSSHLSQHAKDPIWCGRFLTEFTAFLRCTRLAPSAALAIFKLWMQQAPMQINHAIMPAGVREHIVELSRKGELGQGAGAGGAGPVEYAGLTRLFPPMLIRRSVAPEERWALLQSHLVPVAGDGSLAFDPIYAELCQSILTDLSRKPDYKLPISQTTVRMMQSLSAREAYRLIFAPATATTASAEGSLPSPLLSLTPFMALLFPAKDIRLSHPVREAWVEMHLAHLPPPPSASASAAAGSADQTKQVTASASAADQAKQALIKDFAAGRNMDALWKAWLDSLTGRLSPSLTQMAAKAREALTQSSVRASRSAITSYVGYCGILGEDMLRGLQAARKHAAPLDVLASILTIVETLVPLTDETPIVALFPAVSSAAEDTLPGIKAMRAVRTVCDSLVLEAVSVLQGGRAFCFDLMSPRYAALGVDQIQPLLSRLSSPTNLQRLPSLASALFGFYSATLKAAQIPDEVDRLGFVLVPPSAAVAAEESSIGGSGSASSASAAAVPQAPAKTKWIFVNRSFHRAVATLMTDKLGELCAAAKTQPNLVPVAEQAWKIVRPKYFAAAIGAAASPSSVSSASSSASSESDATKLLDLATFNAFLSACATSLPAVIAAREKPLLLTALVHHLRAPDSRFNVNSVSGVTGLEGWRSFLLSAVDACGAEWPSRSAMLVSSVADISLQPVRECMENACSDRDPQIRLQQYLSILRVSASVPSSSSSSSSSASPASSAAASLAASSLHEWAMSLEFVQKRTKNEAGLYRKEIYSLINAQIATKVGQSLTTPPTPAASAAGSSSAASAAAAGPSVLASVQQITETLSAILRDDVSKRDSVAKNLFQSIGRTLLTHAVSMSVDRPPQLAVRRMWIQCGLALDWVVLRTIIGEDAVRRWVWPLSGLTLSASQSLTESQLDGQIQTAVIAGVKGGENAFATLRQQVYRNGLHVHAAAQDVFTAEQAVELLTGSFLAAQQQQGSGSGEGGESASSASASDSSSARPFDFLVDGCFFPSAEAEGGRRAASASDALAYESQTLKRVQALLTFCGKQWTAVPVLVRFFETIVATVADPRALANPLAAPHFKQTFTLFQSVRALYADGSAWYELPPLARACSVLFESAVARSNIAVATTLRPVWTEMQMHKGKISSLAALTLQERGWLVAQVVPLRGRHALPGSASSPKPARMAADKADSSERSAIVLRDLLALSPSAFHAVWQALLTLRDDIFSQYLGRTRAALFGIFDPAATWDAASNSLQPSFDASQGATVHCVALQSKDLSALDAKAMQTFTRLCLRNAMNQSLSATVRSAAITQFVESPATSHADVIELLKDLQARVAFKIKSEKKASATGKGEESKEESKSAAEGPSSSSGQVVDDAADLLLESVILKVFSIDGCWFVLSYLLRPDVIANSPQRTTASILTNLRLWAPIDRTVAVLRILLEPRRRRAISLFLQKQILRLLFECMDSNEAARQLFQAEWQQRNEADTRMSADVMHEVIKMCVAALSSGTSGKSALAWSVVEDLVADSASREIDPATLLLLFVSWVPASPPLDSTGQIARNGGSLANLVRTIQPVRKWVAGVEDPTSFGAFHSKLTAEAPAWFAAGQAESASSAQACKRFAALMHKLSEVSSHPFLRVLARIQQFAFSAAMSGCEDELAIKQVERLMIEACNAESTAPSAAAAAAGSSGAKSGAATAQYVGVELDSVSQYSLQILPRLFAGLSLQVLTRRWLEMCKAEPQSSFASFCAQQPCALRLTQAIGTLLHTLLHTPPIQAARRMRASTAVSALLSQVSQSTVPPPPSSAAAASRASNPAPSWVVELAQVPFRDLLNFLRADGAASSVLPAGVERAGAGGASVAAAAPASSQADPSIESRVPVSAATASWNTDAAADADSEEPTAPAGEDGFSLFD